MPTRTRTPTRYGGFVFAMAVYAREVMAGELPAPYTDEKADALRRLAALINAIVYPRKNVLPMAKRRKRR